MTEDTRNRWKNIDHGQAAKTETKKTGGTTKPRSSSSSSPSTKSGKKESD